MARIYLASDDEITSIIEKLKGTPDHHVILVVPKNTTLLQSVINVRLLKKKADEFKKTLGIVTTDQTSKHLAMQVGLSVYAQVEDVPKTDRVPAHKPTQIRDDEEMVISKQDNAENDLSDGQVRVKQYDRGASTEPEHAPDPKVVPEPEGDMGSDETEEPERVVEKDRPSHETNDSSSAVDEDQPEEDVVMGKEVEYPEEPVHHHRSHLRPARRPFKIPSWVTKMLAVVVILGLVGVATAAVYVPKAEVTLHVPTESSKKTITLLVDGNATSSQSTTLVGIKHEATGEGSGEAKSTGKKSVGDKAKGTVTISNSWSTDTESLAKNTALVSSDKSLTFRTVSDATIAGASVKLVNGVPTVTPGKTDVSVIADQPGDQYNIGASKFTIQGLSSDKSSKITGQSAAAMSGGTTKDLTVVAGSDIDAAKKDAETKASTAASDAVKANVPTDELFLAKTVVLSDSANDANHATSDEADTVTATAHASAVGYGVHTADLENALKALFQDGLSSTKQVLLPDLTTIDWATTSKSATTFELSKEIEGQISTVVDAGAVQKLANHKMKSTIAGDIKDTFAAEQVDVTVSPAWWPLMPFVSSRIVVHITQ